MNLSEPVSRGLRAALVASSTLLLAPVAQAQRLNEENFTGPMRDYQIELAKVMIVRARNTGYRSPFGGTAIVTFVIDKSGLIQEAGVKQTSGSRYLDSLAMEVVRVGASYPPFPPGSPFSTMNVTVPFRFPARH